MDMNGADSGLEQQLVAQALAYMESCYEYRNTMFRAVAIAQLADTLPEHGRIDLQTFILTRRADERICVECAQDADNHIACMLVYRLGVCETPQPQPASR